MNPAEKVRALYATALAGANLSALPDLVDPTYTPHVSGLNGLANLAPGIEALERRLSDAGTLPHRLYRVIADGDLVCAHALYEGEIPVTGADIFRFNEAGLITEHWNSRQPIPHDADGGEDRLAGGGDADLPSSPQRRAEMRSIMAETLRNVWSEGRADRVADYYSPAYVQHNPDMPGGYERIVEIVSKEISAFIATTGGPFPVNIHQLGAAGDLIFVRHSVSMIGIGRMGGYRSTNTDIFRIGADNRMIEHWDVLEIEGEPLPDTRTLF